MSDTPQQEVTQAQSEALSVVGTLKAKIQALIDDAEGEISGELATAKAFLAWEHLREVEAWIKIHIFGDEISDEPAAEQDAPAADSQDAPAAEQGDPQTPTA